MRIDKATVDFCIRLTKSARDRYEYDMDALVELLETLSEGLADE